MSTRNRECTYKRDALEQRDRFTARLVSVSPIACILVVGFACSKWLEAAGGTGQAFETFGRYAFALSVPMHVVLSATPFPSELVGVANGMLYGFALGAVLSWVGWWLGALLEYSLVRRGFCSDERQSTRRGSVPEFLQRFPVDHPLFLVIGRQLPFGFHAVNIAAALGGVPFRRFLLWSAVANVPYALISSAAGAGFSASSGVVS